jgi:hypothetical protein
VLELELELELVLVLELVLATGRKSVRTVLEAR